MDYALGWTLALHPFLAIALLAFLITLLITLIYKYTTDQNLMKQLKDELKELQKELKTLKDHPDKALKVQKQMMETNTKYMMQSLKATLYTFLPIIIIFGWMSAHLAFYPLAPGEGFDVTLTFDKSASGVVEIITPQQIELVDDAQKEIITRSVTWQLKAEEEGTYVLEFMHNNKQYTKKIMVNKGREYISPVVMREGLLDFLYARNGEMLRSTDAVTQINVGQRPVKPLESISLFGWHPGWLGTYIILSILFSLILRKALKVY
jgi:uncharacterized membrane protein (DUF106 family)